MKTTMSKDAINTKIGCGFGPSKWREGETEKEREMFKKVKVIEISSPSI